MQQLVKITIVLTVTAINIHNGKIKYSCPPSPNARSLSAENEVEAAGATG